MPGDTQYESLMDVIQTAGGIDDVLPLQMIADKDLTWVEEWVSCHTQHLVALNAYLLRNQQPIPLENYPEIGFHNALPAEGVPLQYVNFEMVSNLNQISKVGLLYLGKARIALNQENWMDAKIHLGNAFMIAGFLMETNWDGISGAHSIYHDALTLLVEQWPGHQFDPSMLNWLPRKNSMAFSSYRAEWQSYEKKANYVRHMDEIPGGSWTAFLATKIVGLDRERIARILFEDWLSFTDQLQGPWRHWQPNPSAQRPEQSSFFGCDYLTADVINCLEIKILPQMPFVGTVLIKSARAEVEMRLAIEKEPVSRGSVANLLSKWQLTNPFTDLPYEIDDQGNFVLVSGNDIPPSALSALRKIPLEGLILKDASGKTIETDRPPRIKIPWITI